MKVLIIGGTGFIGYHVVRELLADGHSMTVIGRSAEPLRELPDQVVYRQCEVGNSALLDEILDGTDWVVHLASTTVPSTADKDPIFDVESNLVGMLSLLGAMAKKGCKRILYVSSGGTVYGVPQSVPIEESHPLNPISSYGIVKVGIESYIGLFARNSGLEYVIVRASNPYGPQQGHVGLQGVVGTFLNRAHDGGKIEIWGDGTAIRDYVYVGDVSRMCSMALKSKRSGIYNCASGHGTSVKQIVDVVEDVTGRSLDVTYLPDRIFDVKTSILSIDKAGRELGWKPSIGLHEGVTLAWEWVSDRR